MCFVVCLGTYNCTIFCEITIDIFVVVVIIFLINLHIVVSFERVFHCWFVCACA